MNERIHSAFAALNGSPRVPDILDYRQRCENQPDISPTIESAIDGTFVSNRPAGSYFELLGTENPDIFASDGYWLLLEPLPAGTYDLCFGGSFYGGAFSQNNNYRIEIPAVPGPPALLGIGALFGFSRKLRKRIKGRTQPGASAID